MNSYLRLKQSGVYCPVWPPCWLHRLYYITGEIKKLIWTALEHLKESLRCSRYCDAWLCWNSWELGALKQCIYKTSVNLKGVCVWKNICWFERCRLGGALPSNASYQRLNTEECRAEQCTASRLLIDTSDYPRNERERESQRKIDGQTEGLPVSER